MNIFKRTREPPPGELRPHRYAEHENPFHLYITRLSPGSRRTQTTALNRIAAFLSTGHCIAADLPWHLLRYKHSAAVRRWLMKELAHTTCNRYLCALRGVLKECWRLGLTDAETHARASDVQAVPGQALSAGRHLTGTEVQQLLATCDQERLIDVRDRAILAVLYGCGLRRQELVDLDLHDVDLEADDMIVRAGKGSKDGRVPINSMVMGLLASWVARRGDEPGSLFMPLTKSSRLLRRRMSCQAVRKMLKKRARLAGVEDFTPHDLRRAFVSRLLDCGVDISTVQQLARHSSVETTQRYDRRDDSARRHAVARLTLDS